MAHAHLIIVGAGWFGLTMARTYRQLYPDASLIILDAELSVGGVWSSGRLYPGLKTNNLVGSYENPDFPMLASKFGVEDNQHIPGRVVHEYLDAFAEHFNLKRHILFGHKVEQVEELGQGSSGGWRLTVTRRAQTPATATPDILEFTADKLVIATGVTAHPNLPNFSGVDKFAAPIFHAKDFLQRRDLLTTARRVVVYGGAKSAWDGVYAYASSGVQVDWVMRESGKGPCWMMPAFPDGSAPSKNGGKGRRRMEDVAVTRLFTLFQPCPPWGGDGTGGGVGWLPRLLRWFLHRTIVGRMLVALFWSSFESTVVRLNGYDTHPETKKLKPWSGVFWAGTSLSVLNYPTDFFEHLRSGKVKVHHADIVSLEEDRTVVLSDGTRLSEVDALHCSTGWRAEPAIKFSPPSLAQRLGIPVAPATASAAPSGSDPVGGRALAARADAAIMASYPILRRRPNVTPKQRNKSAQAETNEVTPYRLYRYAVPPAFWDARKICIIGTVLTLGQAVTAQCQSLWASAYLEGDLPCQSSDTAPLELGNIDWQTELQTRFHRLRTPASTGDKHGEFTFETVPFYDLLLKDLGLETRRKSSWWKDWTEHYGPADFKGLVDEWLALSARRKLSE